MSKWNVKLSERMKADMAIMSMTEDEKICQRDLIAHAQSIEDELSLMPAMTRERFRQEAAIAAMGLHADDAFSDSLAKDALQDANALARLMFDEPAD